jgi:hypothetical protein
MTVKKRFAALVFLISLCSLMGFANLRSVGFQKTKAAAFDLGDQRQAFSCAYPRNDEDQAACAEIEAQILASTVHIELLTWVLRGEEQKLFSSESHATILGDRYLVTHNHFKYSLTNQVEAYGEQSGYVAISLRHTSGRLLLYGPLKSFTIVHQDAESLILSFVDWNGQGLFEAANLPSAEFTDMHSISLKAGDELAQIDWDGVTTHVDWVRVEQVIHTGSVPKIQVDNYIWEGSSGGGVFLNGVHIGNNWKVSTKMNQVTNEITGRYSTVALNSSTIAELEN